MRTLVLVEHDNHTLYPATLNALSAVEAFPFNVTAVIVGYQCQAVAQQVAALKGVHEVWVFDNAVYEHPVCSQWIALLKDKAADFKVIAAAATTFGKNILPGLAAQWGVAQISDVTKIIDAETFEHPIYAGNAIECVKSLDEKIVMTVRTTAFNPVKATQVACPIHTMDLHVEQSGTRFIEQAQHVSTRPALTSAKIVVSGGRGLQSAEQFKLIETLADALGAAVGASRAAVDAGYVSNDCQVGQTGQVVAPELYIAIGISGAVQHLAGMKDSKVIVVINKDEEAPIFQIADYGLVGNLFELVPQFIEQLKEIS